MAIKIIKEGKRKVAVYRANCTYCDCVFEFNKEDAFFGEDRDGKYATIDCPHCNTKLYLGNVKPFKYDLVENTKEE